MRIGIDIGGTKAAVMLIDGDSGILLRRKIPTGTGRSSEAVAWDTAAAAQEMLNSVGKTMADVSFVGIGVPGTVNAAARTVVNAPNLQWQNVPLAEQFFQASGKMPVLVQDTRAAAWCEARALPEKQCVVCVTLGTGIGSGIVIRRQVWHGALGTAGEIGHIPVVPGGRLCACGRRGCMEAYASGSGIARSTRERNLAQTSEEVFQLAEQGNTEAQALLKEAVSYATMGIAALINVLSPDALIFSGGLSRQRELYVAPLTAALRQTAYAQAVGDSLLIAVSRFGEDAPALGAAWIDEAGRGEEI